MNSKEALELLDILKKYKVNIYDILTYENYQLYKTVQYKYRIKEYMTETEWNKVMGWLKDD